MSYTWWNLIPQHMDGTLITIGSFPIRYYGLMYLVAFFTTYKTMAYLVKKEKLAIKSDILEGLITWAIVGILIGARFGYVFFYNFEYYSQHISEIILPFSFNNGFHFTGIAGMSYHGGLIGGFVAGVIFIKRNKIDFWMIMNLVFTAIPIGYTWGRIGNFLNGELYGRATESGIGMLFPSDKTQLLRHPSQLYESLGEGILLFTLLFFLRQKSNFKEHILAFYLIGYGTIRYIIEFFREPDAHIMLNAIGMSRGQVLCSIMILVGIGLYIYRQTLLKKLS